MTRQSSRSRNQILQQLHTDDRDALLRDASPVRLPAGHTLARVGDPVSAVFFPDSGVLSVSNEMATGHQLAVAAVGAEGAIGVAALFGGRRHRQSTTVIVESAGLRVSAHRFSHVFSDSEKLRRLVLAYMHAQISELMTAVACNRVHPHRQRLARWLLTVTDKAKQCSLPVTHDTLAQMVGGPRHAVTVALNELRAQGAILHLRGRVDVLDRSVLIAQACECYGAGAHSGTS